MCVCVCVRAYACMHVCVSVCEIHMTESWTSCEYVDACFFAHVCAYTCLHEYVHVIVSMHKHACCVCLRTIQAVFSPVLHVQISCLDLCACNFVMMQSVRKSAIGSTELA